MRYLEMLIEYFDKTTPISQDYISKLYKQCSKEWLNSHPYCSDPNVIKDDENFEELVRNFHVYQPFIMQDISKQPSRLYWVIETANKGIYPYFSDCSGDLIKSCDAWVKYFRRCVPLEDKSKGSKMCAEDIDRINKFIVTYPWEEIDILIESCTIDRMETLFQVCWVRTLCPFRSQLKNWKGFVERIHKIMNDRGENADSLMVGLI